MFTSIIAIVRTLAAAVSAKLAWLARYRSVLKQIAAILVFLIATVIFAPVVRNIMAGNDVETERLYWASVEQHPRKTLYCKYLEKYPHGQFKATALRKCDTYLAIVPPLNSSPPVIFKTAPGMEMADVTPQSRYQVKGGVAIDTITGLMWMRCSLGQNWDGSTCLGTPALYTWDGAMDAPDKLRYAGYSDWRLPSLEELRTLVYCSSDLPQRWNNTGSLCEGNYAKPTLVTEVFPQTVGYDRWSSSSLVDDNGHKACWVGFDYGGRAGCVLDGSTSFVRLVRGGGV